MNGCQRQRYGLGYERASPYAHLVVDPEYVKSRIEMELSKPTCGPGDPPAVTLVDYEAALAKVHREWDGEEE